ncbi:MAG TPA: hypothetical protein VLA99_11315 [Nitrospiraceae bacterium]|nr:hypothetical protein [Nitrospiraceae bacterium]
MSEEVVARYQVTGLDERERGFNRTVEVRCEQGRYRAFLRYEQLVLSTAWHPAHEGTIGDLIQLLQDRGYRQLKSRASFRGEAYLGSQEPWIEYPDPPQPAEPSRWFSRLLGRLAFRGSHEGR